jgi:quercetin dioxygenase-like cupin family protein
VTDGTGWIQQWGGPIEEIRKGDVIWIPAGVKHWHGATPTTAMTHIAIQEQLNGKAVETVFDSRGVIIGYADQ